ncbi:MAG: 50S ribosomal protein L17 [Clostridia bacterium]|nr:50S ribosomal protein L17 [Clostridia bacterium]
MPNRKLNKATDQRDAMLRNMVTAFLWNGKLVTTEARAKEVRPIAEKLITLAVSEYKNSETVKKTVYNEKEQQEVVDKIIDKPSKLHARRQIMAYLYDLPLTREPKEKAEDFRKRVKETPHPVVEKLFRELAPKYDGTQGGYVRIYKLGPRRGDGAEVCMLELK